MLPCWGQQWHLAYPSSAQRCWAQRCWTDDSVVYTVKLILLIVAIKIGVLCFYEICSFLPTFHSSQFSSPWVQLILSCESALFMCDVVCWDCPFLFLPVPAQFKDHFFLKAFLQWKKYISPFTHPPTSLSVSLASVVPFYALIPFGPGYITIAPLLDSSPQEIDTLERRSHLSFMCVSLPHTHHIPTYAGGNLRKCSRNVQWVALNRILALAEWWWLWDISILGLVKQLPLGFFCCCCCCFVYFYFCCIFIISLFFFFSWEYLDHSFLSSGSLSLFFFGNL